MYAILFFFKAMKGEKGIGGTVTTADGLSEELTEEAFSEYCLKLLLQAWLLLTFGRNLFIYLNLKSWN